MIATAKPLEIPSDPAEKDRLIFKLQEEIEKISSQIACFRRQISRQARYKPAVFYVNRYIRPKYACPRCGEAGVSTAHGHNLFACR